MSKRTRSETNDEEVTILPAQKKTKIRHKTSAGQMAIKPQIVISIDPGTRNLGWAILTFSGGISFRSIQVDENYTILGAGRIDLKQQIDDEHCNLEENTSSLTHLARSIYYYFSRNTNGEFLTCLEKLISSGIDYEYRIYSENQEGIGHHDREINPWLPDMLSVQCFVSGHLTGILREKYGITSHVYFPPKTGKWGNSTCPHVTLSDFQTKGEKTKIQTQNKRIRKNYFVYYVQDLLERQKNNTKLDQLYSMSLEDRAHVSDAITQGMRSLLLDLWLMLSDRTGNGGGSRVPSNGLDDETLQRVLSRLKITNLVGNDKEDDDDDDDKKKDAPKKKTTTRVTKKKKRIAKRFPVFVDA